jgi:Na+/proline symporter
MTGASFAWFWPGLWAGWVVSALWVAPKFQKFKALTVADYVEKRYNSKVAKAIAACLILVAYTVYLIGQYVAGGILLQTVFGIPMAWGSALTIIVTMVYTQKGGMKASTYSDFVQAMVMAGCFFAAIPVMVMQAGGLEQVGNYITELDPRLTGWYYSLRT